MRNLTLIGIILFYVNATAQDMSQKLSVNFTNTSFIDFVIFIEQQTDFKFFYDETQLDSLSVNIRASRKTINEILSDILKDTDFKYSIDNAHYVYITFRNPIITELPNYFFSVGGEEIDYNKIDDSKFSEAEKIKTEKVIVLGVRNANTKATATLTGYVKNTKSGESLIGTTIMIEKPLTGAVTDVNGYYSITLPKGSHVLKVSSLGMKEVNKSIIIHSDSRLNFEMEEDVLPLKEVIIESNRDETVMGLQMGISKIDFKTMKQLPTALGEVDVIKSVLTLPGVQSVGEGTVGFNVRGGGTDQNLIIFNEATIFNPSHLFGFFSAFNPDIIKNIELYKSGVPAEYGGRISSVLDISTRDGNKRKWSGGGGISPITGRFTLEGPITKDKLSVLISGRSTYSDWLLSQVPSSAINKSQASFFDVNANLSYESDTKNSFSITAYSSQDQFKLQSDTVYKYKNQVLGFKWKHIFNSRLLGTLSSNYSGYTYTISSYANPVNAFRLNYTLGQIQAKVDFDYFVSSKFTTSFGSGAIRYNLEPGDYQPIGDESIVAADKLQPEQAIESFAYAGCQFEVSPQLLLYAGIRYSMFNYLGSHDVYIYPAGSSPDVTNTIDTIRFRSGQSIARYNGPEYRISARYNFTGNASFKLSYNRHRQYLQMLSNTTAIAPTDVWKLSDTYIKPLIGDQISAGYYVKPRKHSIEVSLEIYYKWIKNSIDYKGGAELIQNHQIEADLLNAKGKSYGAELMIKRTSGKLNGWISYTYSRSLLQTKGKSAIETINRGKFYPSNYDKPHAVNFIGNYKFSRRYSMSLNLIYSTGRPITLPIAKYTIDGLEKLIYSDRNQYRIPDYFRTDVSFNMEGNHKIKKFAHSYWSLSAYNLTGRRNAYSIFFTSEGGTINSYKLSIFGTVIPTISYNFKF